MDVASILQSLRALSEPTRLRLLALLLEEELSVAELQEALGMGQSRISASLGMLRRQGLVLDRRVGKNIYYAAVFSAIAPLRDAVTAAVKKRETSMSTGIGFGIGIPHASTDLIYEVVGALGRSTKGVNFDALDNQPVKLVMLFLVPQGQFQKHLHTLANIAKLLHKADFREALEKSSDADAMLAVIREHGKK